MTKGISIPKRKFVDTQSSAVRGGTRRVRSDGWRDRVSVKLVHGQCAAVYAAHAAELANSFGARACRVRVDKPRRIWLDFLHTDPLAQSLTVPP